MVHWSTMLIIVLVEVSPCNNGLKGFQQRCEEDVLCWHTGFHYTKKLGQEMQHKEIYRYTPSQWYRALLLWIIPQLDWYQDIFHFKLCRYESGMTLLCEITKLLRCSLCSCLYSLPSSEYVMLSCKYCSSISMWI